MTYSLFPGCNIPARVPQYLSSATAVLKALNIEATENKSFNCCGYPMRNIDRMSFLTSAARNLALAEREDKDILVLCKCCFGTLKKAEQFIHEEPELRIGVNKILAAEGLEYKGNRQIKHLLSVLYHEVGIPEIKKHISSPFSDLSIAVHYGCHALRPSDITQFDDPVEPVIFDRLVEATGAKSIVWDQKLECCGAPATGINDKLASDITRNKKNSALAGGADFLCTACPYCQMQFDQPHTGKIAPVIYSQLLGLAMGMNYKDMNLTNNIMNINHLINFLG